ncbi:hypothetical protein [Kamptonema formosum]|uniref:hypothetical protein n=1 Tax=Kamptonema formosum TaxID=331992 RepID=UPI00037503CF|nr:hypothetical protein [Oscillatoria sp. PCC 10802]
MKALKILDFGFWILDFGFWILDFGFWILSFPATLTGSLRLQAGNAIWRLCLEKVCSWALALPNLPPPLQVFIDGGVRSSS